MTCKHIWKTVNTIPRKAHLGGSKKFKSGFEEADEHGIKILTVRQKQCSECGKKRTTVEISKAQLDAIYNSLSGEIKENLESELSTVESKVRKYLINVSKGKVQTRHERKAMYKEVWLYIYPARPFGRGNTNEVVEWIVNISDYDTNNDRPPLNSLVVRGDTGMPGNSWDEWKKYSTSTYGTADVAQNACWRRWR
jgi:hypothetical protein